MCPDGECRVSPLVRTVSMHARALHPRSKLRREPTKERHQTNRARPELLLQRQERGSGGLAREPLARERGVQPVPRKRPTHLPIPILQLRKLTHWRTA